MATQAAVQDLFRRKIREGNDRVAAALRLDVRFSRPVAAFAARVLWRFFTGGDALVMRIFVKGREDVGMTSPAHVAANVIGRGGRYR